MYVYSWSIWQGHIVCYVDHKFWIIVDILKVYDSYYRILIVEIDSTNSAIYFYDANLEACINICYTCYVPLIGLQLTLNDEVKKHIYFLNPLSTIQSQIWFGQGNSTTRP
jgi:hypothetical protein